MRRRILLVGATGAFGARLARLLARWDVDLILSARRMEPLRTLARELEGPARIETVALDRRAPDLVGLAPWAIVDAAGPFQASDLTLARAAVAVGAHYVDIADGRDFVAGFPETLDADARAAGVLAVTGASSTPALSAAALDQLTAGWRAIDTARVTISPGARAPRGRSVVAAILSYVGRPVRVFAGGGWTERPGWSGPCRVYVPGLGRRWASLCDTPDLDMIPDRFAVRRDGLFLAGLELSWMHLGLWLLSWPVRWGLARNLVPLAGPLRAAAGLASAFGSDRGGMVVEAAGEAADGGPRRARWSLVADAGAGPNVPVAAAAAVLRGLADGSIAARGARACVGLLDLDAIMAELAHLPIRTGALVVAQDEPVLFRRVLGDRFGRLPPEVRRVHGAAGRQQLVGRGRARGASNLPATLGRAVLGLPRPGRYPRLDVAVAPDAEGETWTRAFGSGAFSSHLRPSREMGRFGSASARFASHSRPRPTRAASAGASSTAAWARSLCHACCARASAPARSRRTACTVSAWLSRRRLPASCSPTPGGSARDTGPGVRRSRDRRGVDTSAKQPALDALPSGQPRTRRIRLPMLALMMDRPLTLPSILEHAALYHGDREVVTRTVEGPIHRYGYAEALSRAKRMAKALLALGVKPGDRVATLAWSTHRHFELYFAVTGIGAVLHTINPRLHPDQVVWVADHAEDSLLLFDITFSDLVAEIGPRMATVKTFVAMTDAAHAPPGVLVYEDLLAAQDDDFAWPDIDERQASGLCYTSGTTGNPKGVLYGHRSTVLHALALALPDAFDLSARDVVMPCAQMYHANAWCTPYAAPLVGAKLVLPGRALDGPSIAELIEAEGVTFLLGVPTIWVGVADHLDQTGGQITTVKTIAVGGSAPTAALIARIEDRLGGKVRQIWGMTETSPLGVINTALPTHAAETPEATLQRTLKQGRGLWGVELRIVGEDGRPLPRDGRSAGALQVRGPWVASAYFKQDGAAAFTADGWFDTGDIATIDPEGYLRLTDRAKDVIKSGGEWISTLDLEEAVCSHPAVAMAAAVGVPHPKWDERPLLLVTLRPGQTADPEALKAHVAERVAKWWTPDEVRIVEALPIGPTGKVLKRELREALATQAPAG